MSQGYSGRALYLMLDGTRIAAARTKGATFVRTPVDTTTDDDDGDQEFLAEPGRRGVDCNIAGVATGANMAAFLAEWEGNLNSDITVVLPNGQTITAAEGFFLGNLELTGETETHVSFTASLQSSGVVTITPPSS